MKLRKLRYKDGEYKGRTKRLSIWRMDDVVECFKGKRNVDDLRVNSMRLMKENERFFKKNEGQRIQLSKLGIGYSDFLRFNKLPIYGSGGALLIVYEAEDPNFEFIDIYAKVDCDDIYRVKQFILENRRSGKNKKELIKQVDKEMKEYRRRSRRKDVERGVMSKHNVLRAMQYEILKIFLKEN